jgi:adenosylcobinamide-GDP ribazoletransferase
MRYIKGWIMSMSMFTAIPMPRVWDEQAKNLIVPALPVVGLVIGLASYGMASLIRASSLALMLQSVLVLLIPLLLTGFIHIDGLMDTADAVFSRAEQAKKLAILKDPHVGSFAVITLGVVLLLQFTAIHTLLANPGDLIILLFSPVIARALTSLFVLNIPAVLTDGYAKSFREQTHRTHSLFIVIVLLVALAISCWLGGLRLTAILLGQMMVAMVAMLLLYRDFRGISGDLSGFVLTVSETAALLIAAALQGVIR